MNRFLEALQTATRRTGKGLETAGKDTGKAIEVAGKDTGKVLEAGGLPLAETVLPMVFPEAAIPLEVLSQFTTAGGKMDLESLGAMLAVSALNSFVKNKTTNAKLNR